MKRTRYHEIKENDLIITPLFDERRYMNAYNVLHSLVRTLMAFLCLGPLPHAFSIHHNSLSSSRRFQCPQQPKR